MPTLRFVVANGPIKRLLRTTESPVVSIEEPFALVLFGEETTIGEDLILSLVDSVILKNNPNGP